MKVPITCTLLFALFFAFAACESPTSGLNDATAVGEANGHVGTSGTILSKNGGDQTIGLCHLKGKDTFVAIEVSASAVNAHRKHGDKIIGEEVNEACEPLINVTLTIVAPDSLEGEKLPSDSEDPENGRLLCEFPITFTAEGTVPAHIVSQQFTLYEEDGVTVHWASDIGPWHGTTDIYPGSPEGGWVGYFTDPWQPGYTPFVVDHTFTYSVGETGQTKTTNFRTACTA